MVVSDNVDGSAGDDGAAAAAVTAAVTPQVTQRPVVARRGRSWRDDVGMATAEYAVGTVAACGFAGILYRLLTSDHVTKLITDVIKRALAAAF